MNRVCANCGIAIDWQATVVDGDMYCCLGCVRGGPCTCDYSNLPRLGECRAMVSTHSDTVIMLPPPEAADAPEPTGYPSRPAARAGKHSA